MTQPYITQQTDAARLNLGRTVLRAYMNLTGIAPSPARVLFDATYRAGQAMDLALRIQRHGHVGIEKLKLFAKLANLAPSDLQLWCVRELEKAGVVESRRNPLNSAIEEVEEQVGVPAPVLFEELQRRQQWREGAQVARQWSTLLRTLGRSEEAYRLMERAMLLVIRNKGQETVLARDAQ